MTFSQYRRKTNSAVACAVKNTLTEPCVHLQSTINLQEEGTGKDFLLLKNLLKTYLG
ncbi:hypothetical protein EXN66_Car022168 [Channa argus]|uniref:Uncharacterized protein n=1 Tax=Channa argus TaxID=215402 RepID=A0A6G1QWM7_CHAAH|nr:hypothetical protein EXN66_Car022168 [Channa argus]